MLTIGIYYVKDIIDWAHSPVSSVEYMGKLMYYMYYLGEPARPSINRPLSIRCPAAGFFVQLEVIGE